MGLNVHVMFNNNIDELFKYYITKWCLYDLNREFYSICTILFDYIFKGNMLFYVHF